MSDPNQPEHTDQPAVGAQNWRAQEEALEAIIRRRTIISFAIFILLGAAAVMGFIWLKGRPQDQGVQAPLRTILNANEKIFDKTLSDGHLARSYPVSAAVHHVRVNGDVGMSAGFDPDSWKLRVIRGPKDTLYLTLKDIQQDSEKQRSYSISNASKDGAR